MKVNRDVLNNLCKNITDGEHASVINDEAGKYFLLSNKNIINGQIVITNNERKISKETFRKINKRTKLEKGDLVISTVGILGKLAIIKDEDLNYDFQRSVGMIKCNESLLNTNYLYHYLNADFVQLRLNYLSKGAVQKCLFISDLKNLEIDFPEISVQQKIAKVLSDLDAKIELNNKINAELEAMAKTLYDYWFVQFDFPDANGKPYKTSGGKMVWNEELRREIPYGWEVGELKEIGNITTGKLDSNAEVRNGKYPFYTCASEPTRTDSFAFDDTVILIAGNNAAGNFHINRFKGKFNAYQRTYITTAKNIIELEYLYQVLKTETKLLKTQGKGSQTKFLTIGMLTGIKILKTNSKTMYRFNDLASPMFKKQMIVRNQNQELSSLRDWLLPMLMNGQVSVGAVAKEYKMEEEVLGRVAEPTFDYSKVINLFNETDLEEDYYDKRKALAVYIINQSLNDVYFGDTKLMKLLHLADYHAIKRNFGQNYFQNVAGPFDGEFKNRFLKEIQEEGLFTIEKPNTKYIFKKGLNHKNSLSVNDYFSVLELQKVDGLITYFSNDNYERPEIFSTLYAVWNNRLIKKQEVTPTLLKKDFLNWDKSKEKYENQVFAELDNMKMIGIIPDGWGKYINKAKGR